ncbi:MAG: hypothetical protein D6689_09905 [Deltaproteobacteria bacterium]|nr:MAG: hypothetical protein D6689_09905 [Deltaproteobacteria bacterium]
MDTQGALAPGDSHYLDGTLRFISSCAGADFDAVTGSCLRAESDPDGAYVDAKSAWDFYTYRRKDNDPAKGPIIYLGGHDYNGKPGGERLVLNTMLNLEAEVAPPDPPSPLALVRSSPIVAPLAALLTYLQGSTTIYSPDETPTTYSSASDASTFVFPYRKGHLYAYDANLLSADPTEYQDLGAPLWDAAGVMPNANPSGCPIPFDGSCRTVFTTVEPGVKPTIVPFHTGSTSTLGSFLLPSGTPTDVSTLISKILAGRPSGGAGTTDVPTLGGIDRSTMALIESSPLAGTTRPTMIYVGGLDGMLHAICADDVAPCTQPGRELWAYIPRTQLGRLRLNEQRIDGSPKVADMFGDFDGTGTREWRTIMAFQLGTGNPADPAAAPAVIAMDVTDPGAPKVLWEANPPAARSAIELGVGLELAMGPIRINGQIEPAVIVSTNNGGTGSAGVYVAALSARDGSLLWSQPFEHLYPPPRSTSTPPLPATGIPGGVAAIDTSDDGTFDKIVVPTLYGDLWVLDAETGTSVYPGPLFRFSTDLQPIGASPTIYRDDAGTFYAIVVSGGYVDPNGATWVEPGGTSYVVSVRLNVNPALTPLSETGPNTPERPFVIPLVGQRVFAPALVAGGELYVVTSDVDINEVGTAGTGMLHRVNLATGSIISSTSLGSSGASTADATANGVVFASGTTKVVRADFSGSFNASGQTAELTFQARTGRQVWLRLQ